MTIKLHNMTGSKIFLLASLLFYSSLSFGQQETTIEVFGTLKGEHVGKIYLFFEDNLREKDSVSSSITDGKFYFKCKVAIPVLAHIHLDQSSFLQDFYIDQKQTHLVCSNKMIMQQKDTLNQLVINSVKGSKMEEEKRRFLQEFHAHSPNVITLKDTLAYLNKLNPYIEQHPKSRVSAYLIPAAMWLSYSQLQSLCAKLDTSLNTTYEMSGLYALLNYKRQTSAGLFDEGAPFHNITLPDINDTQINTRDIQGDYFLVVCWASWCVPCRKEVPSLKELSTRYKDKGLTIIGVSFDHIRSKWINAINQDGTSWTQLMDAKTFGGDLASYYAIRAIPRLFLLDKDKKIIMTDGGSLDRIAGKIEVLLK